MENLRNVREDFVQYLRDQLVGPAGGEDEVLRDPPDRRYLMGTLYPRSAELRNQLWEDEEETNEAAAGTSEEDRFADDPVAEANAWLPSSLGLSFFTNANTLQVTCHAATYEREESNGRRSWKRNRLSPSKRTFDLDAPLIQASVLDGHARVHIRRRRYPHGWLVTCALVNVHVETEADRERDREHTLYQVGLTVRPLDGEIKEYPSTRLTSRDPEEQELRVQYRHAKTFSVGHGCATTEHVEDGVVREVSTEVMPRQIVEHIRAAGPTDTPTLRLAHLSDPDVDAKQLAGELHEFAGGYRTWLRQQEERRAELPGWAQRPALRIIERIRAAVARMESGVETLTRNADPHVLTAFRLANRAMALQMRHYKKDLAGTRRQRGDAVPQVAEPGDDFAWRPFQLGYFLLLVDGLVDDQHPDRDIVDLLWFPTGGGKTEAYLLVASFVILLRRLRDPVGGGGTAVLSRYTLSLLTTQQFQRTATTACALEYLRRGHDVETPDLGGPITIGLWVGLATTPNTYDQAVAEREELLAASEPDDRFLLERCPWCGTEIVPRRHTDDTSAYGIAAENKAFRFFCTRPECEFHDELPVAVVDEHLYENPPTILLGTVDKFARLAWVKNAGRLFGGNGTMRPSLIIQDELHLLSGPLGSTVGIYESAVLELCSWDGHRPKVISSTATIRRSADQIRALYGRDVQLFPPAGLDARHSYFAEPDPEHPGRLYVGVMAQGHTSTTSAVHTMAAMLNAPLVVTEAGDARDAYWTLVAYHNSLRELGRTMTLVADDIDGRLRFLGDKDRRRRLGENDTEELTSNISRSDQPRLLERLGKRYTERDSISFLASTNMLSVGVDVGRLALMLMNGQPKTTAEYIQATSRVGRAQVPGLVVVLLRADKPRDRSHYETFGVYHQSLYRHVEPTSVTPWSLPARDRALHAVLVILARHGLGLAADDQAGDILHHDKEVDDIVERIVRRTGASATAREADAVRNSLTRLVERWRQVAQIAKNDGQRLYYTNHGRGHHNLLRDFGRRDGEWETLQSMRNVDHECLLKVRGAR